MIPLNKMTNNEKYSLENNQLDFCKSNGNLLIN